MTSDRLPLIALCASLSVILAAPQAPDENNVLQESDTELLDCKPSRFNCEFGAREDGDYLLGTTPILVDPIKGEILRFIVSFNRELISKVTQVVVENRNRDNYGGKVQIKVDKRTNNVTTDFTSKKSQGIDYVIAYFGK